MLRCYFGCLFRHAMDSSKISDMERKMTVLKSRDIDSERTIVDLIRKLVAAEESRGLRIGL